MAKIQIKSETRHELSFFPNSFDDYVPKDSKVRMVDRIVRSMDINPLMDTYAGTGELREYENSLVTFKPFLDKYRKRHGKQSKCVTADSGYGSEENYEYMEMEEMVGYVKYNWFHKEQHKPFKEDVFNQANFYYNRDEDYYVCPMGQHMNPCGQRQTKSGSDYVSVITLYRAQRCEGCPLGSLCKKAKGNRTIYVNHKLNAYKKEAFLLLTSEEGMKHRSQRPIEPEAAFGQMKEDMHYKRFRHFGKDKVYMDIGLFGIGFNLKKHLGIKR